MPDINTKNKWMYTRTILQCYVGSSPSERCATSWFRAKFAFTYLSFFPFFLISEPLNKELPKQTAMKIDTIIEMNILLQFRTTSNKESWTWKMWWCNMHKNGMKEPWFWARTSVVRIRDKASCFIPGIRHHSSFVCSNSTSSIHGINLRPWDTHCDSIGDTRNNRGKMVLICPRLHLFEINDQPWYVSPYSSRQALQAPHFSHRSLILHHHPTSCYN